MTTTTAGREDLIRGTVDRLTQAAATTDVDMALTCYAEDARLTTSQGTFTGSDAIAGYLRWSWGVFASYQVERRGIGLRVLDHEAVAEQVDTVVEPNRSSVDPAGFQYSMPTMVALEFNDAGTITRQAIYQDHWLAIKQIADQTKGLRGRVARAVVRMVDKAGTRGMPLPS